MDIKKIHEIVKKEAPNICQISVADSKEIIYSDEWNGYRKDDCTHIMSVTKGIVSLLIGICIDMGLIKDEKEKVIDFFPEYQVKRGEKTIYDVTIEHLLTMRAPYKGKGDPWTKVCTSENWTYASLDLLGGRKGFTDDFDYRTVCLHILSGILYQATGMNTVDFANKYLFEPLGISEHKNYYAKTAEEHKAFTIEKEPKGNVWFADSMGIGTPGYGLCMSAEDMIKIGQMCLQKGKMKGKQIVSEEWIRKMTRPKEVLNYSYSDFHYGYLWWIINPEKNIYAAIGNSGNEIYVNAEKGITVAVTSYFKPSVADRTPFIEEILLPEMGL